MEQISFQLNLLIGLVGFIVGMMIVNLFKKK